MTRTNTTGQLRPLNERFSQAALGKRDVKIWARRTVADKILASQSMMARTLGSFFKRGFFGRLKWLFIGR